MAVLREGHLAAIASPQTLQRHGREAQRYRIIVDRAGDEYVAGLRAVEGVTHLSTTVRADETQIDVDIVPARASLTSLLRAASGADVDVRSFSFEGASPSDVFAALTVKQP